MFGELVTAYLFLAGVGAGGVAAASVADLLFVHEPFGADVNLGAWAVALLTAVAAALALARFLYVPWLRRCAMVVAETIACGLAVVVAVYAGPLLQTLSGVRLWSSPWVPALFALSAASCGCALLMAGALFVEGDGSVRKAVRSAARVDVVVIVAEAVAAAGLLAFALGSDHAGVRASATSLMHGPAALPWWAAFVALALAAALVLVGALGLRAAVVEAGAQRPLELQEAEAPASVPSENEEAAGLRSAPSAEKSGGEGSATEREDVTLWSN